MKKTYYKVRQQNRMNKNEKPYMTVEVSMVGDTFDEFGTPKVWIEPVKGYGKIKVRLSSLILL